MKESIEAKSKPIVKKPMVKKVKVIKAEVYSRVVGYYRPVQNWNKGKKEEFKERNYLDFEKDH